MEFFPIERTIIFRVFLFWFAASIKPQQSQQHRRQRPRPARDGGFRCMCRPERWAAPETSRPSELPSALISSSLRMSVPALPIAIYGENVIRFYGFNVLHLIPKLKLLFINKQTPNRALNSDQKAHHLFKWKSFPFFLKILNLKQTIKSSKKKTKFFFKSKILKFQIYLMIFCPNNFFKKQKVLKTSSEKEENYHPWGAINLCNFHSGDDHSRHHLPGEPHDLILCRVHV